MDEEVEELRQIKETGSVKFGERKIEISDIKDRIAVSQSLHKHLITVIEFVKPSSNAMSSDEDLDAKLNQLIERRNTRINQSHL